MASSRQYNGQGMVGGDEIGPNPTDRAKMGTKKSILTDLPVDRFRYTVHIRRSGEEKRTPGNKRIRLVAGSWKGY